MLLITFLPGTSFKKYILLRVLNHFIVSFDIRFSQNTKNAPIIYVDLTLQEVFRHNQLQIIKICFISFNSERKKQLVL